MKKSKNIILANSYTKMTEEIYTEIEKILEDEKWSSYAKRVIDLYSRIYVDHISSTADEEVAKVNFNNLLTIKNYLLNTNDEDLRDKVAILIFDKLTNNSRRTVYEFDKEVKYTEIMTLGEYIEKFIEYKGHTKTWVAKKCGINYKTFVDKLKRDSITAIEFFKIARVLGIRVEVIYEHVNDDGLLELDTDYDYFSYITKYPEDFEDIIK